MQHAPMQITNHSYQLNISILLIRTSQKSQWNEYTLFKCANIVGLKAQTKQCLGLTG